MRAREPSAPQQAPTRAAAVLSFYGGLAVVAFFWHATSQGTNNIWFLEDRQPWTHSAASLLLGVFVGLTIVRVFRVLEHRTVWLPDLNLEFRAILGTLGRGELVVLATASALGEELMFRGAMLDAWGFWVSSLAFAALHIPPRRSLWPWTASSLLLGLGLACLTYATGNLGAAVAAHFTINVSNLAYITRRW